jgi:AcrR family transcriptional regulator
MSGGTRARRRAAIEEEILRVGRAHLAEYGAAAVSLRAVARDLGMVSSAIYRYVESRDELLTRLIVDAYDSLGDHVDSAMAEVTGGSVRERFVVLCRAIRSWALEHPHQYALLYGSPVPQYHAPPERTSEAGTRIPAYFTQVLSGAAAQPPSGNPRALAADAEALERAIAAEPMFTEVGVTGAALSRGLAAWSLVFGALSTELFEQLGPDFVLDPEAHFEAVVTLASDLVLGSEG